MALNSPEELAKSFAQSFNDRDLDALVRLFHDGAVFSPQPGTVVSGDGIRLAFEAFRSVNAPIDLAVKRIITAGDIAEIIADWRIDAVDQDGEPMVLEGTTADVARRGTDGSWRYVIDNPFGTV